MKKFSLIKLIINQIQKLFWNSHQTNAINKTKCKKITPNIMQSKGQDKIQNSNIKNFTQKN